MTAQFEIWIDGKKTPTNDAKVSVLDRGFLYGDSVFETIRTYRGKLFALDEHLSRLIESAQRVFIEAPCSARELREHLLSAVEQSQFDECYVRVMITRGVAALGLDPRAAVLPLLVVILAPLSPPSRGDYEQGIRAVTFHTARPGDHTAASGAKVGNYLVAVLAQKKAAEAGAKEALIVNEKGDIIEGATSNLFWMKGETLFTVPIEAGILEGITRTHILQVAPLVGLSRQFSLPKLPDLLAAEAVFISSSIREILSVVEIDGQVVGNGGVHPKVTELHHVFRSTAEHLAEQA